MNKILNSFDSSSIFSKIDLRGAYNLLKIKEGDENLTALQTKYGSYEYLVMPFGLTNAPTSFQNLVNDIFQDLIDVYFVVYLDDVMIFSRSEVRHVTHVSTVLTRLRANNVFAKASKCLFHVTSVEYLGYVVSSEGLKMDQEKVQQILNWPPPRNLKALQSFLGSSNFDGHFIKNYSKKISSLTSFLKKNSCFPLNEGALKTDTSNYALNAVLSQVSDSGKHPIAFNSRKPIPEELHYEINDKELLGIVWALKRWRAFLLSLSCSFEVLTNNSSLQYFISSKFLTHHQCRWAEFLSKFHFSITYRPGRLPTLPDSLSSWDNIYTERGEDFISKNPMNVQQLIKQDEVQPSRYFSYRSIPQELGKGKSVQDYSVDSSYKLPLFKALVVVPNDPTIQLGILQKHLDSPIAGHPGQEKTLKVVNQAFYWSGMTQFIKDYVSSFEKCSRNKNIHHKMFGLLKPLPIPNGPWICLSIDFITQLPLSNSFDSILVVVDRFSKMVVFIPTMSSITSLDLAHLFIKNIFSKHGLPSSIVSDRGPLFVSSFWTNICQKLNISRALSTAYHPEMVNQIIEQYLWIYVIYHQDESKTLLHLAEFTYNNSYYSSTKESAFFTVYGRDPQVGSAHITQYTPAGKLSTKIQSVQQDIKRELEVAINRFKRYADKSRASPPVFNPGDMVWLSSKNIKSTRPTKKLSERWLGPFPILKKVSTHAYHLKLPSQWKSIHPVFHISLLEPVKTSTIPNWHSEPPPPIIIEEEEEWEVSQILDSKLKRGKLWCLVDWKGCSQDLERSTWEPTENLKNCPELVKDFHSLYPDNLGPNSSRA
ncbi:hypothetical protein O181_097090 [Austropuccinia psidii MF-1]|uniref:Reverse transcriptase n=1 Tax=Austropuccinia psidii MF-1 TaxID=1389203 RepID=A0A9Q3PDL8_9BASI|nr:hypothetical protein [Austropuccinia psidii MF-1]